MKINRAEKYALRSNFCTSCKIKSMKVKDFSLAHTVECGQIFRFDKVGGWYYITDWNKLFKVRQEGNRLYYTGNGVTPSFIRKYFSLGINLGDVYKCIDNDEIVHEAIKKYRGMRLIRQEPWQCLFSYICSARNRIANIKKTTNNVAAKYGTPVKLDDYKSYLFPAPSKIAKLSEKQLRSCGVGFRAKYLIGAYKNYKKIKWNFEGLKNLKGVGDKIAGCVCLFSQGDYLLFPVDVWVGRIMKEEYGLGRKEISSFVEKRFGKYAGWAHEYLFYYRRKKE
ncbi:MAG: DNA glycosylase [Candidatus Micrarchaeota archaeon]